MCNLSWTPPLLEDNSKMNPVYNTKKISVLTVSEEEELWNASLVRKSTFRVGNDKNYFVMYMFYFTSWSHTFLLYIHT